MVINKKGGNKGKKMARKHTSSKASTFLRVANDPRELYAIVTKMNGNNMFMCVDTSNITRLGHIRRKFSGRGKHDNLISLGTWVLVGLREYQSTSSKGKIEHCDILEVYNSTEKERLRDSVDENWSVLINNDQSSKIIASNNTALDDIIFSTDAEIERNRTVAPAIPVAELTLDNDEGDGGGDGDFDFDDI